MLAHARAALDNSDFEGFEFQSTWRLRLSNPRISLDSLRQWQRIRFPIEINILDTALRYLSLHILINAVWPAVKNRLPYFLSPFLYGFSSSSQGQHHSYLSTSPQRSSSSIKPISLRVWFETWGMKSASLLICIKLFHGIVLAIQGHLERFTMEISKCLQLYQLLSLGFIRWLYQIQSLLAVLPFSSNTTSRSAISGGQGSKIP